MTTPALFWDQVANGVRIRYGENSLSHHEAVSLFAIVARHLPRVVGYVVRMCGVRLTDMCLRDFHETPQRFEFASIDISLQVTCKKMSIIDYADGKLLMEQAGMRGPSRGACRMLSLAVEHLERTRHSDPLNQRWKAEARRARQALGRLQAHLNAESAFGFAPDDYDDDPTPSQDHPKLGSSGGNGWNSFRRALQSPAQRHPNPSLHSYASNGTSRRSLRRRAPPMPCSSSPRGRARASVLSHIEHTKRGETKNESETRPPPHLELSSSSPSASCGPTSPSLRRLTWRERKRLREMSENTPSSPKMPVLAVKGGGGRRVRRGRGKKALGKRTKTRNHLVPLKEVKSRVSG